MKKEFSKKTKIIAIVACIAVIAAGIGLYFFLKPDAESDIKSKAETKPVTLTISADGKSETYEVETEAETLSEMLVKEGYVKNDQSDYGLYIQTVYGPFKDGRTADGSKEEWWNLTKNGETLMVGADEIKISDGEKYELSLVVGYDKL